MILADYHAATSKSRAQTPTASSAKMLYAKVDDSTPERQMKALGKENIKR